MEGGVNFPVDGGLEGAMDGDGLVLAWWAGSGSDTSQTPEDPFSPTQSGGVWKVHGTMVVGPEPEQLIKSGVFPCRRRGELAEFTCVLIEREIMTG